MTPQAQRWLDMADYDLDVAGLCFDNQVYVYCVFFCHLSLEKLLKAILLERLGLEEPPHTHSLSLLADMGRIDLPRGYMSFLVELSPHSILARYAESRLEYDEDVGRDALARTQEVYAWLRSGLT